MNGVDLAYPQVGTDFTTLAQHVGFSMIKATDGVGLIDAQFSYNRQAARDVGLARGFYHFAEGNNPIQEAQHFIDVAAGALLPGEILALDWEIAYSGDPIAWSKSFLDYVYNATGVRPLVYSFISKFNDYNWAAVGPYAIWVAAPSFSTEPKVVPINYEYVMQQYGTIAVPGVNGAVDVDHFFGDRAAWEALGKPAPVQLPVPAPPVQPTPMPVPVPTPAPVPVEPMPTPATPPVVINDPVQPTQPTPTTPIVITPTPPTNTSNKPVVVTLPPVPSGFWHSLWGWLKRFLGVV